jgi:hypothetical protein
MYFCQSVIGAAYRYVQFGSVTLIWPLDPISIGFLVVAHTFVQHIYQHILCISIHLDTYSTMFSSVMLANLRRQTASFTRHVSMRAAKNTKPPRTVGCAGPCCKITAQTTQKLQSQHRYQSTASSSSSSSSASSSASSSSASTGNSMRSHSRKRERITPVLPSDGLTLRDFVGGSDAASQMDVDPTIATPRETMLFNEARNEEMPATRKVCVSIFVCVSLSHLLPSPSYFYTSPHLTSPHLTSPHLTSPHLTSPHLTSPHRRTTWKHMDAK